MDTVEWMRRVSVHDAHMYIQIIRNCIGAYSVKIYMYIHLQVNDIMYITDLTITCRLVT